MFQKLVITFIVIIVALAGIVGYFTLVKQPVTPTSDPLSITLTANPTTVAKGGSTALTWSTINAVSCEASSPTAIDITSANWSGQVPLSGNKTIQNISHDIIFELTCRNSKGASKLVSTMVRTSVPESTREIQLFYYNRIKDKEIAEWIPCSPDAVIPVKRTIPFTKTPIQDTIKLLLEGKLTSWEKSQGFEIEFPLPGFELVSANLKDGILTLEFADPNHSTIGGSCRVGLLASSIIKTAKQFPEVKEVKFEPRDSLFQP